MRISEREKPFNLDSVVKLLVLKELIIGERFKAADEKSPNGLLKEVNTETFPRMR